MKLERYLRALLLPLLAVSCSATPIGLLSAYFREKAIKHVILLHCWTEDELFQTARELSYQSLQCFDITDNEPLDLERAFKFNYYKIGVFFDLNCDTDTPRMQQITQNRAHFNESYFWLMHTDKPDLPIKYFETLPLSINAEVSAVTCDDNCNIYDVYNPSYRHYGNLSVTLMGYWNEDEGLRITNHAYKYKRRANMGGLHLNCSITINNPVIKVDMDTYLNKPIDRHFDTMQRYNYALFLQLARYYNFTMDLKYSATWGYLINGTWNGIMAEFVKGAVDMAVVPFQFTQDRITVMDFTVVTWVARITIIFRHPKKNVMQNNFLKPLEQDVWYATLFVSLLNWVLLYSSVKARTSWMKSKELDPLMQLPFSNVSLTTTAALSQQGISDVPEILSYRMIFLVLFTWGMLLFQFYGASIVVSLIAEPPRFINTVEDLANSQLEFGAHGIGYMYNLFNISTDPQVRYMFDKKMALNKKRKTYPFFTPIEGLKKVKEGGFAFQVDTATAYKIIEETFTDDEICDLAELQLILPQPLATGTNKGSPFNKMVTYGLRHLVEQGTAQRLLNVWLHSRPQCPESHSSKPTAITLSEFFPAIVLVMYGCAAGAVIAIVEAIIHSYKKKRAKALAKLSPK